MYVGKIVEVTLSKFIAREKGIARIVRGEVLRETDKAIQITNVRMIPKPDVNCAWCGAELTNGVSRKLGVGPICIGKYGERMNWQSIKASEFEKLTDAQVKAMIHKIEAAVMTTEEIWVPKRGGVEIIGDAPKRVLAGPVAKKSAPAPIIKNAICW